MEEIKSLNSNPLPTPPEPISAPLFFKNQEFTLKISLSVQKNEITFQIFNNGVMGTAFFSGSFNKEKFYGTGRYFLFFENLHDIFCETASLVREKKASILGMREDEVDLGLECQFRNVKESLVFKLKKEVLNDKSVVEMLVSEVNVLKNKVAELEKWRKEMEFFNMIDSRIVGDVDEIAFISKRLILNESDEKKEKRKVKFNLIYRATRDGDKTANFHDRCDNKGPTLVLIETIKGRRFGGYTEENWIKEKDMFDNKAFCFSIDLKKIYNIKKEQVAIYGGKDYIAFDNNILTLFPNVLREKGRTGKKAESNYED